MKSFEGYLKQTAGDTYLLLAGGGIKPLSDFWTTTNSLGNYLPLTGGTMALGEGLKFHSDNNYFGTDLDARIISLIDGNDTICDGGLIIDERSTLSGVEYVTELLRIRDGEFKWRGNVIWHAGNDGSGSGLDADLLDGYHFSDLENRYVNVTGDVMTGNLIVPCLSVGNSSTSNFLEFHGLTGDTGVGNTWDYHFMIGNRIWNSSTEASELVIICENDVGNGNSAITGSGSGPDRIRHIAAAHLFQTYTTALSGTLETVATSSYLKNILELNTNSIHSWVSAVFDGNITIGTGGSDAHLYARTTNFTNAVLSFYDDTSGYGTMTVLGGGGCTVVGGGESAHEFAPNVRDENLYLTADANVNIFTNLDGGYGYRRHVAQFTTGGDTYLYGNLYLGANPSNNFIAFYGNTGDAPGSYVTTFIGEHLWGGGESTELLLMKFNDVGNNVDATTAYSSGPDRIRYCAHAHLFQIRTNTGQDSFATMAADGNNKNVLQLALDRMTVHVPIHIVGSTTSDMSYSTSNPKIYFSENGGQAVGIVYTDWDAYRASKGLKVMGVDADDNGNVWLEAQGYMYAVGFSGTSDRTKKRNIKSISKIFPIVEFNWKHNNKKSYGFIAQDIVKLGFGDLVDGNEGNMSLEYSAMLSYYLAQLSNIVYDKHQEIDSRINMLEKRILDLELENQDLRERLNN